MKVTFYYEDAEKNLSSHHSISNIKEIALSLRDKDGGYYGFPPGSMKDVKRIEILFEEEATNDNQML